VEALERLADLAVRLGANVQPGQVLRVSAATDQLGLVRAVADFAYRQGARFVDVDLDDPYVHRARVLHAPADSLAYVPDWPQARVRELDRVHGASIRITAPSTGLDDLDPRRVNLAQPPHSPAWREVQYRVNNTIVPGPTAAWAHRLRPELAPDEALDALWADIAVACRLDQPDPVAAWRRRFAELGARARALTGLRLDAVHLRGPGTDLVVGLPRTARWEGPTNVSERGIEHAWNLPSEEVYTAPDRDRVHGRVRLTRPAVVGGRTVAGVVLTFRDGRVVDMAADDDLGALREFAARDDGTARLGELALVDADSAVGSLGRAFGLILLDENTAAHIALGFAFPELVDTADRERVNQSGSHLDLTVGSAELEVTGIHADGREQPLLSRGEWQLGRSGRGPS
jgi:aminopeptidase